MIIHSPLCKDRYEQNTIKTYVGVGDYQFFLTIKECRGCGRKQHESASTAQFHRTVFIMLCDAHEYPPGILDLFLSGSGYTRNDLAWALGVGYSAVDRWCRNVQKKQIPRYMFLTLQMMIEGFERGPDIDNLAVAVQKLKRKFKDSWCKLASYMQISRQIFYRILAYEPVHAAMMPFFSYYRSYPDELRQRLIAVPTPLKKQEYIIG